MSSGTDSYYFSLQVFSFTNKGNLDKLIGMCLIRIAMSFFGYNGKLFSVFQNVGKHPVAYPFALLNKSFASFPLYLFGNLVSEKICLGATPSRILKDV